MKNKESKHEELMNKMNWNKIFYLRLLDSFSRSFLKANQLLYKEFEKIGADDDKKKRELFKDYLREYEIGEKNLPMMVEAINKGTLEIKSLLGL